MGAVRDRICGREAARGKNTGMMSCTHTACVPSRYGMPVMMKACTTMAGVRMRQLTQLTAGVMMDVVSARQYGRVLSSR
jgi:hypothetical protein